MGKQLFSTLAFAAIGGLTGGLFTAGAFSSLGASLGVVAGGALFGPKTKTELSDLSFENTSKHGFYISEFAGTVGNVGCNYIAVGKDDKGDMAGLIRVKGKSPGKGGNGTPDSALLIGAVLIGRALGGTQFSPEPLFVDKIEQEDSEGRKCIYDRYGASTAEKGFTLTQTTSTITGRVISETSDVLRLYTGTDEQMPDSALSAFWGDELSANRGCAYVVFNRLPIASAPTFYFTVRSATTNRRQLITQKLQQVGIPAERLELSAIPSGAVIQGIKITSQQTTREICEKMARRTWCDFAFDGSRIVATSRTAPSRHLVTWDELGAWNATGNGMSLGSGGGDEGEAPGKVSDGRLVLKSRAVEDMCSIARVAYTDSGQGYDNDEPATAPQSRATHTNALDYDLGEVDNLAGATNFALALRDEDWSADLQAAFSVLSGHEDWLPGDVLELPLDKDGLLGARDFLLLEAESQTDGILNCQAQSFAAHVYTQNANITAPTRPSPVVQVEAEALFGTCDMVSLDDATVDKPGLLCWVSQSRQKKWTSGTIRIGTHGNPDKFAREVVSERATCGILTAAFVPSTDTSLELKSQYGELGSATTNSEARNVLVIEPGLVITFDTATLLDYDPDEDELFYSLSNLISGRFGSDYLSGLTFPVGARWALLRDASGDAAPGIRFYPVSRSFIGADVWASCLTGLGTQHIYTTAHDINFVGRNVEPLSPIIENAALDGSGNLLLSGRGRTRYAADGFENNPNLHRMSEPRYSSGYKYQLRFGTRLITQYSLDDRGSFDWTIPAATVAGTHSAALALCGDFGPGRETAITF
ncbi:hypothetical protein EON83_20275 [bacterium]|nr:MAG: hypothetical protein EON83_20275 [bacterium]